MSNPFAKRLLEKLQQKTNTKLDAQQLEALANHLHKSDLQKDDRLTDLVRQLSVVAGITLSKEKEEQILRYLKANNIQQADMKTLLTALSKKLD